MSDIDDAEMGDPLLSSSGKLGGGEAADSAVRPLIGAFVAAIGALMFGYTLGFTSPGLPPMIHAGGPFTNQCDTSKTPNTFKSTQGDLFGSLVNIGCMAGAILAGQLCDKIGRKKAILAACIPFGAGWALIAIMKNFLPIIIARILTGVGVGIVSVAVPVYIAETAPARLRGALGAVNQLGIVIGILVIDAIGFILKHHDASSVTSDGTVCGDPAHIVTVGGYRFLCWIGVILTGALFVLMGLMPESPNWLCKQGREEEAETVLITLRGANSPEEVSEELQSYCETGDEDTEDLPTGIGALFSKEYMTQTIIGIGIMVFQQFSGINAVIFYSGQILDDAGFSNPDMGAMILMGVQVCVTTVACFLMDKAGRKVLLLVACTGMTICATTMGAFFYIKAHSADDTGPSWLSLLSLFGYIISFSLGLGAIPWIILSEIFPEHIRGTAASVATCINWVCSFILTESFTQMNDSLTTYGTFWLFAVVLACCGMFVITLVPETKGKTLQEVEQLFKKKK